MKKILLTFVFGSILAGGALAQAEGLTMKSLTINALMQYGQKLYDRRDFEGARAVFNHILVYDHHQPQALNYIREMDHPVQNTVVVKKSDAQTMGIPDLNDAKSLREAIEAKRQSINKLHLQIMQMRANMAALSKS